MPRKSFATNLLESLDIVTDALNNGKIVDVIYTDFSKAFDKVDHKLLLLKIQAYGFSDFILDWIKNFLSEREQRVILGNSCSDWIMVTSGVPQGSVLGPLLFLIYINDLPENLSCISKMYADDSKLFGIMDYEEANGDNLQLNIDNLVRWCSDWSLDLNFKKCGVMHYGAKNPIFEYSMKREGSDPHILTSTSLERDLGVMMSNKLKWADHIQSAVAKANRAIGIIRNSFKSLDLISLRLLYCSLVRPHLDYAVSVWNPYFKKDINLLEGVQRRATKLTKELKNLPYETRLRKLELTTLEKRRERGDLIQMYKIINGLEEVHLTKGPNFVVSDYFTRGNSLKLRRELVKNCTPRFNFLTNRVVENWNSLPEEIVKARNLNSFKAKIDCYINGSC
jgi:hypothetical protein